MTLQQPQENKVDLFKYYIEKWRIAKKGSRQVYKFKCSQLIADMTRYELILLAEMARIYTIEEAKLALCAGLPAPAYGAFTTRMAELRMIEE